MPDETPEPGADYRTAALDALGGGRPERATAFALLALADEVRGLRQDFREAERRRTVNVRLGV